MILGILWNSSRATRLEDIDDLSFVVRKEFVDNGNLMKLGFLQISSRAARLGDIVVLSFRDLVGVNFLIRIAVVVGTFLEKGARG